MTDIFNQPFSTAWLDAVDHTKQSEAWQQRRLEYYGLAAQNVIGRAPDDIERSRARLAELQNWLMENVKP